MAHSSEVVQNPLLNCHLCRAAFHRSEVTCPEDTSTQQFDTCSICMEKKGSYLTFPCGHFSCTDCIVSATNVACGLSADGSIPLMPLEVDLAMPDLGLRGLGLTSPLPNTYGVPYEISAVSGQGVVFADLEQVVQDQSIFARLEAMQELADTPARYCTVCGIQLPYLSTLRDACFEVMLEMC